MPNSLPIAFIDLDDNIFNSKRKSSNPIYPATVNREGVPHCFMTEEQYAMYNWLRAGSFLIPTTNRGIDAFNRVTLEFDHHAIVTGGGIILDPLETTSCRSPNQKWLKYITDKSCAYEEELNRLNGMAIRLCDSINVDARIILIEDAGIPFYIEIKHRQRDTADLMRLLSPLGEETAFEQGWRLNSNDNNITVMPPFFSKDQAVAWYLDNLAGEYCFLFGMGDSLSDLPFMRRCHFAATPTTNSQVFDQLHS